MSATARQGLLLGVLVAAITASVTAPSFLSAQPTEPIAGYPLGPEDTIEINVWTHGDLTRTVTVRPDGRVSFPPIGEVRAEGLSPLELARTIRSMLQQYVKNPVVTVVVVKEKGKRISILGQVRSPGQYLLREQARLADAVALAGGPTFAADISAVFVTTGDRARPRVVKVNLERALRGEEPESNLLLQSDDVVFVPGTIRQALESLRGVAPNIQIQIQLQGQGP